MRKTLLERLLDAGYPKAEIYHHMSDLYEIGRAHV